DGDGRAQHPELELVAGKGEGGGAVAVGGVHVQVGQHVDAGLQLLFRRAGVVPALLNGGEDGLQLLSHEHGDDGGGRFVGAQAVVVASGGHGDAQQVLVLVHPLDDGGEKQQEAGVFGRLLAGV